MIGLLDNPQIELEVSVAAEYKIPHSEFLDWGQRDRDLAIGHFLRQRASCPSCGTRKEEWDPEAGGHRRAYTAVVEICQGCVQKEMVQDAKEFKEGRGKNIAFRSNHPFKRKG